jgi:curli biogenesis system outer membrane secretion channel CsgG
MRLADPFAARFAVAAILAGLSACAGPAGNTTGVLRDASQYSQPVGPRVTPNTTPLEPAFACMNAQLQAVHVQPIKIGVGLIRDYTGKFSEQDGGSAITQGGSLMAITALGKLHPSVRTFERFDTQVAEWELGSLAKRYLGDEEQHQINNNGQTQQVPWKPYMGGSIIGTDYFIVGGITELNYAVYSGGVQLEIDQLGPSNRVFVANVAVDLRLIDTNTLEVLQSVSLQKQIVGYESKLGVFTFFGNLLVNFQAGEKNNEPTQLAVRTTIEQAVLELLGPLAGVDADQCIHYDAQNISSKVAAAQPKPFPLRIARTLTPLSPAPLAAVAPTSPPVAAAAAPAQASGSSVLVPSAVQTAPASAAQASPATPTDAQAAVPVAAATPVNLTTPPVNLTTPPQTFAMTPDTAAPAGVPQGEAGPRGIGINASRRTVDYSQSQ